MKRLILSMFFVFCFCCGSFLTAGEVREVTQLDISQLAEEHGRVLKGISRPALGADVYMAHVEFGHIDKPVLLLSSDLADKDAIVEVRAHNFQQGVFKRHMVRIHPGQEFVLDMASLTGFYDVLQFCSLEPFTASIRSEADQSCTWIKRKELVYNPSISPEEEEQMRSIAKSTLPPIVVIDPIGGGGGSRECVGFWKLDCMTPSKCGTYSQTEFGSITVNGSCRMVYWGSHSHVSCGTNMSTTVNSAGCYADWWHYGDCPWYVTNCYGEMYSVYIYFPI